MFVELMLYMVGGRQEVFWPPEGAANQAPVTNTLSNAFPGIKLFMIKQVYL